MRILRGLVKQIAAYQVLSIIFGVIYDAGHNIFYSFKNKKIQKKRAEDYKILIEKFKEKHQIVANYYTSVHLSGNGYIKGSLDPWTEEGKKFQSNMKSFFGKFRAKFPGSGGFEGYGWGEHDYTPLEDLQQMYDMIEKRFPEAFVAHRRNEIIKQLGL